MRKQTALLIVLGWVAFGALGVGAETDLQPGQNRSAFRNLLAGLNAKIAGTNEVVKGWFHLAGEPGRKFAMLSKGLEKRSRLDQKTLTFLGRVKAPQGASFTIALASAIWDPAYKGTSWNKQKVVVPPSAGYQEVRALFDYTPATNCYTRDVAITVDQGEIELAARDDLVLMEGSPETPLPPSSAMEVLNNAGNNASLMLYWRQTGGSYDAQSYAIQVYDEEGNKTWLDIPGLEKTSSTLGLYRGLDGHAYRFRCLARDVKGSLEKEDGAGVSAQVKIDTNRPPPEFPFKAIVTPASYRDTVYLIKDRVLWQAFGLYDIHNGTKIEHPYILLKLPAVLRLLGAPLLASSDSYSEGGGEFRLWAIRPEIESSAYAATWIAKNLVFFDARGVSEGAYDMELNLLNAGFMTPPKRFKVQVLPPIRRTPNTGAFAFSFRNSHILANPGIPADVWQNIAELFEEAGYKGVALDFAGFPKNRLDLLKRRDFWVKDEFPDAGLGTACHWATANILYNQTRDEALRDEAKTHPFIDITGKVYGSIETGTVACCSTYLIAEGTLYHKWKRRYLEQMVKECPLRVGIIANDFEPGGRTGCFCKDCLKQFAAHAGLEHAVLTTLTPQEICDRYHSAWVKFKGWVHTQMLARDYAIIKAVDPKVKYAIIDTIYFPREYGKLTTIFERWEKDYASVGDFIDLSILEYRIDSPEILTRVIADVHRIIKKPFMYNSALGVQQRYYRNGVGVGTDIWRYGETLCLFAASFGAPGTQDFTDTALDGQALMTMDKISQEISVLEDWYYQGEALDGFAEADPIPEQGQWVSVENQDLIYPDVSWPDYLRIRTHKFKDTWLVSLFNFNPRQGVKLKVRLPGIPDGAYALWDPITQESVARQADGWRAEDLREGVVIELPFFSHQFLVAGPKGQAPRRQRNEDQGLRAADAELKKKTARLPDIVDQDLRIAWDDLDGNKAPEILVETPLQKVWINPLRGGQVYKWAIKTNGQEIVDWTDTDSDFYRGGIGMDVLLQPYLLPTSYPDPNQGRYWGSGIEFYSGDLRAPYQIRGRKIEKQQAVIELSHPFDDEPLRGWRLTKRYIIPRDATAVRMEIEIASERSQPVESFWTNSLMQYLAQHWVVLGETNKPFLARRFQLIVPGPDGVKAVKTIAGKDMRQNWFAAYMADTREGLVVKVDDRARIESADCSPGCPACFSWSYLPVKMEQGDRWQGGFEFRYVRDVNAEDLGQE